jgi:hypothetical protein
MTDCGMCGQPECVVAGVADDVDHPHIIYTCTNCGYQVQSDEVAE